MIRSLILLALLTLPTVAHADDRGMQLSPDGTTIAVTKDLGGARWSIALDVERATVSGTVYRPGDAPAFVWCVVTDAGDLLHGGSLQASCLGADRCPGIPCGVNGDDWTFVADVTIPGSFFLP
jgi:hypothetical protein